ncbi:hypothetical protein [Streptomyces avermitilis]|uniref:hypothetical protein n=1 Tax=Streptomyces avermitilis TaxID=33903 RepID=UPI0033E40718
MSARRHPPLKSITITPGGPYAAPQPVDGPAVCEPKGVAVGVPLAVRPGSRRDDGRRPVAWLHITAPASWSVTPSAHSWCTCGYERRAIGRAAVLQLVAAHAEHHTTCSLLDSISEGRAA